VENLPKAFAAAPVLLQRKFFNKSLRYMDAYRRGAPGRLAEFAVKKYRGHRALPDSWLSEILNQYEAKYNENPTASMLEEIIAQDECVEAAAEQLNLPLLGNQAAASALIDHLVNLWEKTCRCPWNQSRHWHPTAAPSQGQQSAGLPPGLGQMGIIMTLAPFAVRFKQLNKIK
jgi:hypothetical protein